ncbi:MAG: HNH endonuclease signature motif containing protein [Nocardioidaceae bacterium]
MSDQTCTAPACGELHYAKGYCKMHYARVTRHGDPMQGARLKPVAERLAAMVDVRGPDECWPWTGALSSSGYGSISLDGGRGARRTRAHRVAFLLANPGVPEPEVVDHLCHDPEVCHRGEDCPHRRCCNPAHLAGSTRPENLAHGRRYFPLAERTHCCHGHEFTEANTYLRTYPDGRISRVCRACKRNSSRAARASLTTTTKEVSR